MKDPSYMAARAKDIRRQIQEFGEALKLRGELGFYGNILRADKELQVIQWDLENRKEGEE